MYGCPDAMEGPTPVSALIHAATMVAAGVYLVARMLPMFELVPIVMLVVAVIGLITFLYAGTLALVMTDIKRALAYSTISHLGLMMLSLGAFGLAAAIFHLVAHGVSKAMLFLGAGSVMHGMHEETDMRKMGGLRRTMPLTAITFVIGAASLAGIAPLSGFFSKDEILVAVMDHRNAAFLALTLAGVALSALYMARMVWLTFLGSPHSHDSEHAHESPALMTAPLLLLAIFSLTLGAVAIDWGNAYHGFAYWMTEGYEKFHIVPWLTIASLVLAIGGVAVGWYIYGRREYAEQPHHAIAQRFPAIHRILLNKYYMDDLYQWIIDRSRFIALSPSAASSPSSTAQWSTTAQLTAPHSPCASPAGGCASRRPAASKTTARQWRQARLSMTGAGMVGIAVTGLTISYSTKTSKSEEIRRQNNGRLHPRRGIGHTQRIGGRLQPRL